MCEHAPPHPAAETSVEQHEANPLARIRFPTDLVHDCAMHKVLPLLLLLTTFHAALSQHTLEIELQHPRRVTTNTSHRGFPQAVHLFEPHPRLPHFVSRTVSVDLLGGITKVGEYYVRILIGNQPVRVQVDTGSSTLALPIAECDKCLPSDQRYNRLLSHTGHARFVSCTHPLCKRDTCMIHKCNQCSSHDACCADENPEACGFSLKYGDGSGARGALMADLMTWGNVSAPVIFGGILHDSPDFQRGFVDGILGMGYKALACNPTCVEPPFQQMVKAGVVDDGFTICITGQGGKLVLGSFDSTLAVSEPKYVPLALSDPPTFYTMNVSNRVTIGDQDLHIPYLSAGILDSGTTLLVVSKTTFILFLNELTKFHCDVPGLCNTDRPWFMPAACVKLSDEDLAKLPTFVFHLGSDEDFSLELRPQDYMLKVNKPGHDHYRCVGIMAMQELQHGTDIIFGNTVMQRYVTHYDRKNKRLGFAEAAPGCGGESQCRSYTQCVECAGESRCSYNFRSASCSTRQPGLGLVPYPDCSGSSCLCSLGPQAGIAFGVAAGLLGSLLIAGVIAFVVVLYSRRGGVGRGGDLAPDYEEEEGDMDEGEVQPNKSYMPVPTE